MTGVWVLFMAVWVIVLGGVVAAARWKRKHWPEAFLDPPQRRRYRLAKAARRCRYRGLLWGGYETMCREIELGIRHEPSRACGCAECELSIDHRRPDGWW